MTYPNDIDNNILTLNTSIQVCLGCGRTADNKQVLVLAQGAVFKQHPVITDKGGDTIVSLEALLDQLDSCFAVGTKNYKIKQVKRESKYM